LLTRQMLSSFLLSECPRASLQQPRYSALRELITPFHAVNNAFLEWFFVGEKSLTMLLLLGGLWLVR
jgi:hypothetical protein